MQDNSAVIPHGARTPLECAMPVAERFMQIRPVRQTYMYRLGMQGILDLYEASGEGRLLGFYIDHGGTEPRFDWHLHQVTGDPRWIHGANELGEAFLADPRRDRDGALLDICGRYTIDILSHYFTFPIILGHVLNDPRYFDDAARQLEIHRRYLEDPRTGLWYSRWGHGLHPNRPNPGLWSRGNGWLAAAWGRTMHLWPADHPTHGSILRQWHTYAQAIAAFQTPSGLFRQLLNRPGSFEEATGSGLFCSGFATAVQHGTLPAEFAAVAYRAFRGLDRLVDETGNVHNVSTTAGGYNFEQQYESCAIFNDAHGDGTVMSACAAIHRLMGAGIGFDATPPAVSPCIITRAVAGQITAEAPKRRTAAQIAGSVLQRILDLERCPPQDRHCSTVLGLLHWHDFDPDPVLLQRAEAVLASCGSKSMPLAQWNVGAELDRRRGREDALRQRAVSLDRWLSSTRRDQDGLILDQAGGYSAGLLHDLLPLLSQMGAVTGGCRYFDEACKQLLGHQRWLEDPVTFLWHSAFGRGTHPRRVCPGLWGLGNAYTLAGMVDLLEYLPAHHSEYVDVVGSLRRLIEALHCWQPALGGWRQILNDYDSPPCTAATALLTYGCAKAVIRKWVVPAFHATADGGLAHLSGMVTPEGTLAWSSLLEGGLDTLDAYTSHGIKDNPAVLGLVLSGCAYGALCESFIADTTSGRSPQPEQSLT